MNSSTAVLRKAYRGVRDEASDDRTSAAEDRAQVPLRPGQHGEVGERVGVEQQQVGPGAGADRAQVVLAEQGGRVDGGRPQHVRGGLRLRPQGELGQLRVVHGPEQVGAVDQPGAGGGRPAPATSARRRGPAAAWPAGRPACPARRRGRPAPRTWPACRPRTCPSRRAGRRSAASMRLACSTERKPASAARRIEAAVYAWPVTYRPALVASSTAAASSAAPYWRESSRSVGELIPPETMTLRKCAPWRSSSRQATRSPSTPSATRDRLSPAPDQHASPAPRVSPCPPVWLSACPQ